MIYKGVLYVHECVERRHLSEYSWQQPGRSIGAVLGYRCLRHAHGNAGALGILAVTGWGVVYQEAGASVSPNAATDTVQTEDFTTYLHLTNGTWVEVQNQAQDGIGGAHYTANFANNSSVPWNEQTLSDGSVSFDAPPTGDNDHFWAGVRGTFTPGTVDGVFVEANMKTNDPSANWWPRSAPIGG